MDITVLGSQGWPGPGGACSGYLVHHDGFRLMLDAGNGTLAELQRHVALDDIDAICISHAHTDHFADLYSLFVAVCFGEQAEMGIPLYAPPGFMDTLCVNQSERTARYLRETFAFHEVTDGAAEDIGPFALDAIAVNHPNNAVGFRVTGDDRVLAYSGDTGPSEAIARLAREADTFVCEATLQGPPPDEYPFHLSGTQAGQYADAANVKDLVLTHLWPSNDPAITVKQAEAAFTGTIVVAEGGLQMEVG